MTYRRKSIEGPEGLQWRLSHRALLSQCGIPPEVAGSDRRRAYMLLHGDDAPGTGWNPSWISPEQAARLLQRLFLDISTESGFELIRASRQRCRNVSR